MGSETSKPARNLLGTKNDLRSVFNAPCLNFRSVTEPNRAQPVAQPIQPVAALQPDELCIKLQGILDNCIRNPNEPYEVPDNLLACLAEVRLYM